MDAPSESKTERTAVKQERQVNRLTTHLSINLNKEPTPCWPLQEKQEKRLNTLQDDKVDTIFGGFQQPTSLRQRISQNRFATTETDWVIYAPNEPPRNVSETNEVDKEKHIEPEAQKPITQKPNKFQLYQRP